MRAALANRESFTRYGIDRPPFLSTLTFKVGKSKDGRDVLLVRSTDAIPEPFVTFLVEVNWARGRLMREYTVLLDPPVYTPGENASTTAPVTAPSTARRAAHRPPPRAAALATITPQRRGPHKRRPVAPRRERARAPQAAAPRRCPPPRRCRSPQAGRYPGTVQVAKGDTLTKIARSLHADTPANIDQTMIALYRSNPDAFGGNINVLRQRRRAARPRRGSRSPP